MNTRGGFRTRGASVVILRLLMIAAFVMAAAGKMTGAPEAVAIFEALGVGQWMRYLTGSMELAGAILLAFQRWRAVGALVLSCVMLGATVAHLGSVPGSPLVPLTMLAVLAAIGWKDARAPWR